MVDLAALGLSPADYAMTVGMVMGEAMNEGLVGMGIVAATGLNRAQNPSAYLSRSAALGDIFAAPHSAGAMISATRDGRSLPGAGRQFSPTFNSNIPGASTEGHQNFKAGLQAALAAAYNPSLSPQLGIRQDSYNRAQRAVEVAVKARDMGIDLGYGVEHFSAPGFERDAMVGRNHAKFGGHNLSPTGGYDRGVTPPSRSEFASRFAAAAALSGVDIPDDLVADFLAHTDRNQIKTAASIVQRQAQDFMSAQLGQDVFPGINYNDVVQPTGLRAADVPNVAGQLGIDPTGQQNFANTYGITPDNYETMGLPDPIGRVDYEGELAPLNPAELNPVSYNEALGPPIGGLGWQGDQFNNFSTDPLQAGFSLPDPTMLDVMSQFDGPTYPGITHGTAFDPLAGFSPAAAAPTDFSDVSVGSYPDITAGTAFDPLSGIGPVDAAPVNLSDVDVGSYPEITAGAYDPPSWSADFNPAPVNFSDVATPQVSGFHSGVDGWSAPETYTPDMSTAREALTAQGRIDSFADHQLPGISYGNQDKINADIMNEIGKPAPTGFAAMSTPDLEAASLDNEMKMGALNQTAVNGWGPTLSGLNDQQADLGLDPLAMGAVGFGAFGAAPQAPAPASSFTSRASSSIPQGDYSQSPTRSPSSATGSPRSQSAPQDEFGGFGATLPSADYASQVSSTFGAGKPGGTFMDAMNNPIHGAAYNPNNAQMGPTFGEKLSTGWSTPGLIGGAALGLATGNPFSAIGGYNFGKTIGNLFSGNAGPSYDQAEKGIPGTLSSFGTAYDDIGISMPHDRYMATPGLAQSFFDQNNKSWLGGLFGGFGSGGLFGGSEGYYGGGTNNAGSSLGDGSYAESEGYSDNNPQGIL